MFTVTIYNKSNKKNGTTGSSSIRFGWLMNITTIVVLLIGKISVLVSAQTCPPPGFDALQDFNLSDYIVNRWYSIKQIVVPYQPITQFYCVYAQYAPKKRKSFFCLLTGCTDKPTISVYNFARRRSVTGLRSSIRFEATVTNEINDPAKAFVGPSFIPIRFRSGSNYWVVAAGIWSDLPNVVVTPPTTGNVYDWAIITTALPESIGSNGKCYSDGGMWIFSHTPTPPAGAIESIDTIADELGLDNQKWLPVEHNGCRY